MNIFMMKKFFEQDFTHLQYIVLAGTYGEVSRKYDGILEYDITSESYKEIATMTQARTHHAASVVPYETFSKWCQ